jgi:hypothetical protein
MSLSKCKCWDSNNILHFKCAVPLQILNIFLKLRFHIDKTAGFMIFLTILLQPIKGSLTYENGQKRYDPPQGKPPYPSIVAR